MVCARPDPIDRAAKICTQGIANGGLFFLFGAGHSRIIYEEMTPRQDCHIGFFALVELAVSTHAFVSYFSASLTVKYATSDKSHMRMTEICIALGRLDFVNLATSTHNCMNYLLVPEANCIFAAERLACDPD